MKVLGAIVVGGLAMALGQGAAEASVSIKVDKTAQRMTVEVDGKVAHVWPVSTARSGYSTPSGTYRPIRMHRMWYSQKYDNSPMPHAIFFSGGYAIHGTGAVRSLGSPASHGCVRLAPGNAATLYALVQQHGQGATRIQLYGNPRHSEPAVARHDGRKRSINVASASGRPAKARQGSYQVASTPVYAAYDPRFVPGNQGYRQVRYVQPTYGYAGPTAYGSGAYLVRIR